MKNIFLAFSIFVILFFNQNVYAQVVEHKVKNQNNLEIAYDTYETNHKDVVILAHGWLMTKNSKAFSQMANDFSKYYDVIVLDFRGHGKSKGKYTFGSEEVNDLKPVIDFAHNKYKHIYLVGFSLGSLISVEYCSKYNYVDKLILVSCPTDFKKIENNVLSPNSLVPTLKKFEWDRWTSIRLGNVFGDKIKPVEEISEIKIPILFIAGKKDPIIRVWHNEELYKHSKSKVKETFVFEEGKHAEDLYLESPKTFMDICLKFLDK